MRPVVGSVHNTVGFMFASTTSMVIQSLLEGVTPRSLVLVSDVVVWLRNDVVNVLDELIMVVLVLTTLVSVEVPALLLVAVVLVTLVEDAAMVVVGVGVVTVAGSCMCTAIFKPLVQGVLLNFPNDPPS